MAEFKLAGAYVEARMDRTKLDADIAKLKRENLSVKVGLVVDKEQAFKARIAALTKARRVKVGVDLDQKAASASLAKLGKAVSIRALVDLSDAAARTGLAALTKSRTAKLLVDVDTRTAAEDLANLTRSRVARIRIDVDQTALSSLSGNSYTADILPTINQPAYQRVIKALDKLTADRNIIIRPSVDTRVAADELRNLTQRRRARIGVDVDTRVAADDLANLTRTRTARVNADLHAGDTAARLDALARDRRSTIDVRVNQSALSSLMSLGSGGGGSGIGSLVSSLFSLKSALLVASPGLIGFGQALAEMGPATAVAVPALLSMVTAFAAIKIGTSGVGDAIKQAFAPTTASAGAATSSLRQVQSAQEALGRATQGVKDAEVQAAAARVAAARAIGDAQLNLKTTVQSTADSNHQALESVVAAERDLTNAQKAARQAQDDLTQARKDAKTQLEDLANQLADSQLSQRQDVINLADAEKQLNVDKAAGSAVTAQQMAKDQLAYDQAVQQLAEQQTQTQRLTDQNSAAAKAGVEGSASVVAAKQGITDANQALADKSQSLADAQTQADRTQQDGARQIAKAERDLSDARAAATKATVDGARSIADANQAVTDAARSLADAQTAGAVATDKTASALAKLAPNARSFVAALVGQKGAWTALKLDVQNRLFEGLGGSFTRMANASMPSLHGGLVGMAGVLNLMGKNAAAAVTNLAKTGTLRRMFDGLTGGMKPLARIPGQLITGLAQISVAAAPAFKRLTTAAGGAVDGLAKKLTAAFKDGRLEGAIDTAIGMVKQLGAILGNVFSVIGSVFSAANVSGGGFLNTLQTITGALATAFKSDAVQAGLKALFQTMALIAKTAGPLLLQALELVGPVLVALAPPVQALVRALGSALGPVLKAVAPLIQTLGTTLVPLITMAVQELGPVLTLLARPLSVLVKALGAGLKPIVAALGPVLMAAARAIGELVGAFAPLLPVIGQMIAALGPVLTPILDIIGMLFTALGPVLSQLGKSLLPPFLTITQTLAGVFRNLSPVLADALDLLGREGLVPIVAALGVVIGDLVSAYANQFVSMFEMLLPIIPVLIPVVVQLAQSLSQILLSIAPLLPQIMLLGAQMLTQLLPAILPLLPVLVELTDALLWLATGTITAVVMPILGALVDFMGLLGSALQPAIDAVTLVTKGIAAGFQWLYDILLGHSIIPDIVNGATNWFTALWNRAKAIFNNLKRDVAAIWNGLWTTVRSTWNGFWGGLSGAIGSARSWIGNAFSGIRSTVTNTWSGLWTDVKNTFSSVVNAVTGKISAFATGMRSAFSNLRDGLGTIWNGIRSKFSDPIKFVINSVYNDGIRSMWNAVASHISSKITLPAIPLKFAKGGVVPGQGKGDTVPAMLTPGERILSLAQVAKLGGHRKLDALLGVGSKGPGYGIGGTIGGIVSSVGNAVSGAVGGAEDWAKGLVRGGLADAAAKAIRALVDPLIGRVPSKSGDFSTMAKDVPQAGVAELLTFLKADDKKNIGGQINYSPGAGVAQWAPTILKALSLIGQPASWLGTVERRMNQESGGNPRAVNLWDSNAKAGYPSTGLMQVIRGTFARFADQFRNTGPMMYGVSTDPLANTYAGLNYAMHNYGSLSALNRPGGYDSGGLLKPGATMAVNRTGRPERVLNADHTAKLDQALTRMASAPTREPVGGDHYDIQVTVQTMTIPSQSEMKTFANAIVDPMREAIRQRENSQRRGGRRA